MMVHQREGVWWLILCIILTDLRDAQMDSKVLFLGAPVRVFPKEISIWITRLSKWDHPNQLQ